MFAIVIGKRNLKIATTIVKPINQWSQYNYSVLEAMKEVVLQFPLILKLAKDHAAFKRWPYIENQ